MRKLIAAHINMIKPLLAALAGAIFAAALSWTLGNAGTSLAARKITRSFEGYDVVRTANAEVYFTGADRAYAKLVTGIIGTYLPLMLDDFGLDDEPYITLVIYPGKDEMYDTIGYKPSVREKIPETRTPMGAYSAGLLVVLSPSEWGISGSQTEIDAFISNGPVIHELAHLLLDKKTNGNYKEWFSEGVALYYENKYTGEKTVAPYRTAPVSYKELSDGFKYVDEKESYRKSYEIIRYIESRYGEQSLKEIYSGLASGKKLDAALKKLLGLKYGILDKL